MVKLTNLTAKKVSLVNNITLCSFETKSILKEKYYTAKEQIDNLVKIGILSIEFKNN